jgi:hypothetical protein
VIAHKLTAPVDLEGIFRYISHLVPAGRHDIDCMHEILPEMQSILDSEDALLSYKSYIGIQHHFLENVVYVKHRKPPNRPAS